MPIAHGNGGATHPLRTAVVGLGYWGPNLVRVLHEIDEAEVVLVCDVNEASLAKVSRRYPGVRQTSRFEEVLADESIEAVVIATPVSTHFELALAALEAHKHVFVEKPMAGSVAEAEALMAAAKARELTLMPGHTFLYSPAVNLVRELIRSDELGEIYFISTSRVNLGLHQSDASVIWDLGPHDFSILRYWIEDTPTEVSALARSCIVPDVPDVAFVNLRFPGETVAHVELSWLAPSKLRRTAIVGSRKMVVYDDTSLEPVRVFDSGAKMKDPETFGEYKLTYRTGDIVSLKVDSAEPLALELADFAHAIRTRKQPVSSAEIGLAVVQVVEAVNRSLRDGGLPTRVFDESNALARSAE